jgi:hypothetical protein
MDIDLRVNFKQGWRMRTRIFVLTLALVAPLAAAQEPSKPAKTKQAERAAMLESLQHGKEVSVRGERYQELPEVTAVERKAGITPAGAVAPLGAAPADIIENKGKLVVFRSSQKGAGTVRRIAGATVYPTVLNARTGVIGVLTGVLIVKPKNMADADAIASSHGLEKSKAYPQLQTVFYKAKAGADLADVSASLQADPRVESAYPEIVEHVRVPK